MEIAMKRKSQEIPFDSAIEEEALRLAALAVRDALACSLPEPDEVSHTFSPRFHAMMHALLRRDAMRVSLRRLARSAAVLLLTLLIGSGLWLSFDAEARADFKLWVRSVYQNSILYQYFGTRHDGLPACEFGWLPEGYEQSSSYLTEEFTLIVFSKENEPDIVFSCYSQYSDNQYFIFNQDDFLESVELNSVTSVEIYSNGRDFLYLWNDAVSMLSFNINSNLSRDVIFKIIANIHLDYS